MRRKIGMIYAEELRTTNGITELVKRKYLRSMSWKVIEDPTFVSLRNDLLSIKRLLKYQNVGIETNNSESTHMIMQIYDIQLVE